jgi:preprotein translocase subunit SecY
MASNPGQLAGVQAGLSELRGRLLFVLFALLVYRIGTHIPVPGINPVRWLRCSSSNRAAFSICSTCSPAARWSG